MNRFEQGGRFSATEGEKAAIREGILKSGGSAEEAQRAIDDFVRKLEGGNRTLETKAQQEFDEQKPASDTEMTRAEMERMGIKIYDIPDEAERKRRADAKREELMKMNEKHTGEALDKDLAA